MSINAPLFKQGLRDTGTGGLDLSAFGLGGYNPGSSSLFGSDYPGANYGMLGTLTAPLSSGESQAIDIAPFLASGQLSGFSPSLSELIKTIGGAYTDPTNNPFFKDVLSSTYAGLQPFEEQEQQKLLSEATAFGQGAGSSPLINQEGLLSENVLNQLSSTIAPLLFQQYGTERGIQNQAMNLGLGMGDQALNTLTGTGGLERGVAQNSLDKMYQEYLRNIGLSEADIQSALGFTSGGISVPYEQPTQYGPSGLSQLLGTGS